MMNIKHLWMFLNCSSFFSKTNYDIFMIFSKIFKKIMIFTWYLNATLIIFKQCLFFGQIIDLYIFFNGQNRGLFFGVWSSDKMGDLITSCAAVTRVRGSAGTTGCETLSMTSLHQRLLVLSRRTAFSYLEVAVALLMSSSPAGRLAEMPPWM